MKKIKFFFLIILSTQLLSCDNIKKSLGFEKSNPNEFLVEKRNSILLPPDYNLLPPDSKEARKNEINNNLDLKSLLNEQISKNKQLNNEKEDVVNEKNQDIEKQILNKIQ